MRFPNRSPLPGYAVAVGAVATATLLAFALVAMPGKTQLT